MSEKITEEKIEEELLKKAGCKIIAAIKAAIKKENLIQIIIGQIMEHGIIGKKDSNIDNYYSLLPGA